MLRQRRLSPPQAPQEVADAPQEVAEAPQALSTEAPQEDADAPQALSTKAPQEDAKAPHALSTKDNDAEAPHALSTEATQDVAGATEVAEELALAIPGLCAQAVSACQGPGPAQIAPQLAPALDGRGDLPRCRLCNEEVDVLSKGVRFFSKCKQYQCPKCGARMVGLVKHFGTCNLAELEDFSAEDMIEFWKKKDAH